MYKRYENIRPVGYLPLTNWFGLAIFLPDEIDEQKENCDFVCAWHDGENYSDFRKCKVYHDKYDQDYIIKGGQKYYIGHFMSM